MQPDIAIVDYGMGNLRSVQKALEHVAPAARIVLTDDPELVRAADRVVFPGQGAMPDCMRELDARGLRQSVMAAAAEKPFLGICIGLQMLFDWSEEGGAAGLGIMPGKVRHMGWNRVRQTITHPLWAGIEDDTRFYFVHSFFVQPGEEGLVAGVSEYPFVFTCAVARDNLFAVQFHPEKSQASGLRLLANFIAWRPAVASAGRGWVVAGGESRARLDA